ncbi:HD domain-containing protein [Candidatus Izimaplasma bacterium]|nr:HD domain-containing protein [Candidatus Izimaplasma bacterium]
MKLDMNRLNRILSYIFEDIKNLSDEDRDLPIRWSVMHMFSTSQLAALVALKRDLNPELLGIIAALHDIGAVRTKSRKNHAKNASKYVYEIIELYNSTLRGNLSVITEDEINIIHNAVINHSDKGDILENPYAEAMKDVDSLDRFLHGIETDGDHVAHLNNLLDLFDLKVSLIK